jgi:hypothetical protein
MDAIETECALHEQSRTESSFASISSSAQHLSPPAWQPGERARTATLCVTKPTPSSI